MTRVLWNPVWARPGDQGRKIQGSVSGGRDASAQQTMS